MKRAHHQRASRAAGLMAGGVFQMFEGSGPTIAGGERSEPPVQSSGREPGEVKAPIHPARRGGERKRERRGAS